VRRVGSERQRRPRRALGRVQDHRIRAERRSRCCTAAVDDAQRIQARIAKGRRRGFLQITNRPSSGSVVAGGRRVLIRTLVARLTVPAPARSDLRARSRWRSHWPQDAGASLTKLHPTTSATRPLRRAKRASRKGRREAVPRRRRDRRSRAIFAYTKPIIASPHAISRVLATICSLPLVDSLPSCKSRRKVRSCGHDCSIWVPSGFTSNREGSVGVSVRRGSGRGCRKGRP
jgi:hypothetical protein